MSNAILFLYRGCLLGHVSADMKRYCNLSEDVCQKRELLQNFYSEVDLHVTSNLKHNCCDACAKCGGCGECPVWLQLSVTREFHKDEVSQPVREVSSSREVLLKKRWVEFRLKKLHAALDDCTQVPLYAGIDIASGLPIATIDFHCEYIENMHDREEKCMVYRYASEIFRIIE